MMMSSSDSELILLCTQLNEELRVEILKRLPIKTLYRFRCVCKSWNSLISSSFFITTQYQCHLSAPPSSYLLSDSTMCSIEASSIAFYNPRVSLALEYPAFTPIPFPTTIKKFLPIPFPTTIKKFLLIDVIHGVVSLSPYYNPRAFILWNPTIRKHVEIPPSPFLRRCRLTSGAQVNGFGFVTAPNNNHDHEFMCVGVWGFYPSPAQCGETPRRYRMRPHAPLQPPMYEVYSIREGRWRKAVAAHIEPCSLISHSGCFVNGSIHWVVSRHANDVDYELSLLTFDCGRKELTTMELPREFSQCRSIYKLFTYHGLLSVFATTDSGENEMWTMVEYGVVISWKKLSTGDREEGFVRILEKCFHQFQGRGLAYQWWSKKAALRVKEPLMSHVFYESMYLMDAKSRAESCTWEDEDGNISGWRMEDGGWRMEDIIG